MRFSHTNAPPLSDHYSTLQVDSAASMEVIRGAYLALMRQAGHHPDLGGNAETARQIIEAYEVLSDPQMRQRYDYERKAKQASAAPRQAYTSSHFASAGAGPTPHVHPSYVFICAHCRQGHVLSSLTHLEQMNCRSCGRALSAKAEVPSEDAEHVCRLGLYLFDRGLLERSEREFETATRLSPQTPHYYYWHGRCLYRKKLYERARIKFNSAVYLEPIHFHYLFWVAQANYIQQRYWEALPVFLAAMRMRPRHNPTLMRLACCYFHSDAGPKALMVLRQALQNDPYHTELHTLYGIIELACGNSASAQVAFRKAAQIAPKNPMVQEIVRKHIERQQLVG